LQSEGGPCAPHAATTARALVAFGGPSPASPRLRRASFASDPVTASQDVPSLKDGGEEGFELPARLKLSSVSDADLVLMLLVKNDYHCAGECGRWCEAENVRSHALWSTQGQPNRMNVCFAVRAGDIDTPICRVRARKRRRPQNSPASIRQLDPSHRRHSATINDVFGAMNGRGPRRGEKHDEFRYLPRPSGPADGNTTE
jgi:hypothetical protein